MAHELVTLTKGDLERRLTTAPRSGSLRSLVQKKAAAGVLLLVDCSVSMEKVLATGERAIDALRTVVADVRAKISVPTAQFGIGEPSIVDDVPEPTGWSTPLHAGIRFARENNYRHLIVISDGMPDSQDAAMAEAQQFGHQIDALFVGNENDPGAAFMAKLATSTGGEGTVEDLEKNLELIAGKIVLMLTDGKGGSGGPIQL